MVKKLLPMQKMRARPLGWEDRLEQEMPSHSSILPGEAHGRGTWCTVVHGVETSGHD